MKAQLFSRLFLLVSSLVVAASFLAGCGDPEADQRAKKMEDTVNAQREGMKSPGDAMQQGK